MEQHLFGNLQLLFVLDPQQLPPVPDRKWGDAGKYCFQSHLWRATFPHHVTLSANHRTSGYHLQELIKESFEGELSESCLHTAEKLARPLDVTLQEKATHLFGTNRITATYSTMAFWINSSITCHNCRMYTACLLIVYCFSYTTVFVILLITFSVSFL